MAESSWSTPSVPDVADTLSAEQWPADSPRAEVTPPAGSDFVPESTTVDDTDQDAPVVVEPVSLGLDALAALVGEYRWIEMSLYRILGEWVLDMPLAAVKLHLDAQSMRHAWHAELWAERLPVHRGADPEALTAPSAASAALFAALVGDPLPTTGQGSTWPVTDDEPRDRPGALPRLAGLYRVVMPRLVTTYERHAAAANGVADGPVARALRLVLNDEIEEWRTGERLVERLVTRPHDVAAVYEFLQHLESVVVSAGVSSGLVALPDAIPGD